MLRQASLCGVGVCLPLSEQVPAYICGDSERHRELCVSQSHPSCAHEPHAERAAGRVEEGGGRRVEKGGEGWRRAFQGGASVTSYEAKWRKVVDREILLVCFLVDAS